MTAPFRLHDVTKRYQRREVLHIQDMTIPGAGIYGVLGPNGSGKTTLMRVMATLTVPDRGGLEVWGEEVRWNKEQLLKLRRQMAMVTQTSFMFQGSVHYNVAYGLRARNLPEKLVQQRVRESLQCTGMLKFTAANAHTLSGGERQKVAIARALAIRPRVLFLDEPTSNIDAGSAAEIEEHIRFINREHQTTVILVTHNLFQARRLAQEGFLLWEGRIIEQGTMERLFTAAQDPRAVSFLQGETVY